MWTITKCLWKMWLGALFVPEIRPALMGLIALLAEQLIELTEKEQKNV